MLNELKEVALSIGDRKRKNAYRDALQVKMLNNATSISVFQMNLHLLPIQCFDLQMYKVLLHFC